MARDMATSMEWKLDWAHRYGMLREATLPIAAFGTPLTVNPPPQEAEPVRPLHLIPYADSRRHCVA
jgi:hypothetical protein